MMNFKVQFREQSLKIGTKATFQNVVTVQPDAEHYTGNYEVVPSPDSVILPTENKLLDSDVTVHPIPYYSVSNASGGNTIYIGGNDEILKS